MLSAALVADADEEERDEDEKAFLNASAMALISEEFLAEEFLAEQAFLKEMSRESTLTRSDVTVKRDPNGKLGMTICVTELSDLVLISAVIQNGAAAKSGLLQAGDVLHAVDGEG
jgi:C-terminal processing protease CtpA/Prc